MKNSFRSHSHNFWLLCFLCVQGQGANQALLDALSLARNIYKACQGKIPGEDPQAAAMTAFEAEMLERSAVKVQASAEAAKFLHTSVAIQEGNVTRGAANKITETQH